jgi:predicted N-formylglutamate amidohydrolase
MTAFLFSCDHATCAVPEAYREIFRGSEDVLTSAEGWEPGALNLAQGFAMKFRTPLVHGDVTRLLMDFGKDGDARWSRFSQQLPEATRLKVADRHERPYRKMLIQRIAEDLRRHPALLHVMIHTDPATDGMVMLETPIGAMLADRFAAAWRSRLAAADVDVRHVSGVETSPLATALAGTFPAERYAQVRLSVSQTFFLEGRPSRWETLKKLLLDSLVLVGNEIVVSAPESPSTGPC